MSFQRQNRVYHALVCCVFLLYLWIALNIPNTFDDWEWGGSIGMHNLMTAAVNSRYGGNLLVVVLTRCQILKDLVMALFFTAIPCCMTMFIMDYLHRFQPASAPWPMKPLLFLTANVLVFLLPAPVWSQTYGWVSGFCNYITSGLFLILYFLFVIRLDRMPVEKGLSVAHHVGIFVCGVLMQLFLENVSAFFFLTTLFLVLRRVLKKQRPKKSLLVLLLGNALGLVLVFSSGIYPLLWSTGEAVAYEGVSYRKLLFDKNDGLIHIAGRLSAVCYYDLQPAMVDYSGILPPAILLIMVLYAFSGNRSDKLGLPARLLLLLLHAVPFAYTVYRYLFLRFEIWIAVIEKIDAMSANLFYFFYLVLVTVDLFLFFRREASFPWLLGMWISPILIIAPMSAINTVFERSFYTTTLCYELFLLLLLPPLWHMWKLPLRRITAACAAVCFLVLAGYYAHVYYDIGVVKRERLSAVDQARLGYSGSVFLSPYPHDAFVYRQDPYDERYKGVFREYYGLPQETQIDF